MKPVAQRTGKTRTCPQCRREFPATQEHVNYARKFCSSRCAGDAARAKARAKWPPRDEVERLYCEEGLSDRALGAHFGFSYQWALKVRKAYGISASDKPHRDPVRYRSSQGYWRVGDEYEHRLVMAAKLGRSLAATEVVHHIDEDKGNNDPDNLCVYPSNAEHMFDHRGRRAKRNKVPRRDWRQAREKVDDEGRCRVCGRSGVKLDAAHIVPRSVVPPGPGEAPDNIVPLCHERCHPAYDGGRLDLLPFLTMGEQASAVMLHPDGLVGALRRVTGDRQVAA